MDLIIPCVAPYQHKTGSASKSAASATEANCDEAHSLAGEYHRACSAMIGRMRSYPLDLPASVAQACIAFQREIKSNYGVFDFLIDTDGDYHFLEYNLNGQFLFLEGGDEICAAIADDILGFR